MMLLGTQLSTMLIDLRICLKGSSLQMAPIQQGLSSCFERQIREGRAPSGHAWELSGRLGGDCLFPFRAVATLHPPSSS